MNQSVKKILTRVILASGLLTGLSTHTFAQVRSPEMIVRSVADNVLENTSFRFIDNKTKKTYSSAKEISAITPDIQVESIYNKWHYSNGVMNVGLLQAAKVLGDKKYSEYTARNFDFIFSNLSSFKQGFENKERTEWSTYYRMNILDDYGALSAAILDLNELVNRDDYRTYTQKAANHTQKGLLRLKDGTWSRDRPRNMTVWADDLYMGVPFMARMGRITGNKKYFDDAIKQVENFTRLLYNPSTNLYYHCYYNDVEMTGVAHWLRCNGWVVLAQTELLNNLPKDHPKRKELIANLLRQIIGYSRYQDNKSGLWHQLIDKQDSYLETSGTAMFTYAVARAVNEGWINKSYLSIAENGWKGVASKITAKGEIEDVCIGTGISESIAFYYERPTKLNDYHAIGAVLLAGTEMIRASKNVK
ncbi:MAG TPA: glycoside hydrolase family 88 protein [Sphingobacteriaceae bacterium]|nr:glycoside hydrolase family 88 protein [Sphingobacteriaceae bacterium]